MKDVVKIKLKKIEGYDTLIYISGNEYIEFNHTLFCEVGEPYRKQMQVLVNALLNSNIGKTIETISLNGYPWLADCLI
jgi:hypothetical protein